MDPVGRDDELARIDTLLSCGGALVLEGEAGIGKTTLWLAGVEHARTAGYRVLAARPAEAEAELSYTALVDLLADVHGEFRALPAPQRRALEAALLLCEAEGVELEPRAVAVALAGVLRTLAGQGAVLVAVDDVQWVDMSTAAALSFALRRADVAALVALRSGCTTRVQLAGERMTVGRLSLGALRELLRARLGVRFHRPLLRRIHERSGGNPFFALELARVLATRGGEIGPQDELPVPEELEPLLAARLSGLAAEPLAAVAALAEPTIELVDVHTLAPAFAAGVLVLDGERIRFDHPLLATAAYLALSAAQRRALHRTLAPLVTGEERARHLALGAEGPDPRLAAALDDAAASARARGAPAAAAELAEWAVRLDDSGDRDAAVRRTVAVSEYRVLAGDHPAARRLVEAALEDEPEGPRRARLLLQRARLSQAMLDALIGWAEEALQHAGDDLRLQVDALDLLAHWMTSGRRVPEAAEYARRALELAERVDDAPLLLRALGLRAWTQIAAGEGLDIKLMERALALEPLCGPMRVNVCPRVLFGHNCTWTGDLARARELLESVLDDHDPADTTAYALPTYLSAVELFVENWERASELSDEVVESAVDAEFDEGIIYGLCNRSVLLAHLGDADGVRRDAAEAFAIDERRQSRFPARIAGWALALLELSLDDPVAALPWARAATNEPRAEGWGEPALLVTFAEYAEAAIATGALDEADELLDWFEERSLRLDRAWTLAQVARCRGLAAAARGDESAATAAFERALREHERGQGRRFERARTLLAQGESLRRFKKKRAAREAIEAALAIFDELGAKLWAAKAQRELARVSGRARTDGLTETERRIAALVATGRSNKEIAGELFVTVRTVETHLTHVYAKLGVRSRTELAGRQSSWVSTISSARPRP